MDETNADRTRRAFEHWNARRFESLLEFFHEDAVWDMTPTGVPGMAITPGGPAQHHRLPARHRSYTVKREKPQATA